MKLFGFGPMVCGLLVGLALSVLLGGCNSPAAPAVEQVPSYTDIANVSRTSLDGPLFYVDSKPVVDLENGALFVRYRKMYGHVHCQPIAQNERHVIAFCMVIDHAHP